MFTTNEIDALVLGLQWVKTHGDPALARAAQDVVEKIISTVSEELRGAINDPSVGTPPDRDEIQDRDIDIGRLRTWCRQGRKLVVGYTDSSGLPSERTVWPFLLGFSATSRMLMAWCELRQDFRMFRTDRFSAVAFLDEHYPEHRTTLRRRWLAVIVEQHE